MSKRFEIKFVLQPYELEEFKGWILRKGIFRRAYQPRKISSVYLDDLDYTAAQDNLDGIGKRVKYRIRWYDNEAENCTFEIKIKSGRLGSKLTSKFNHSIEDFINSNGRVRTEQLISIEAIQESGFGILMDIPVIQVNYEREYFSTNSDIRVTLDQNLSFNDLTRHGPNPRSINVVSNKIIVEFKFAPTQEQDVAEILKDSPFYPQRNSKYVLGLSLLGHLAYL